MLRKVRGEKVTGWMELVWSFLQREWLRMIFSECMNITRVMDDCTGSYSANIYKGSDIKRYVKHGSYMEE